MPNCSEHCKLVKTSRVASDDVMLTVIISCCSAVSDDTVTVALSLGPQLSLCKVPTSIATHRYYKQQCILVTA
jgi:hypothetical protein